jgi:hypothetical protein
MAAPYLPGPRSSAAKASGSVTYACMYTTHIASEQATTPSMSLSESTSRT